MISVTGGNGLQGVRFQTPRAPSYTGMGHQALLTGFMEELRRQQAESCERDVDRVKRAGVPDRLTGKRQAKTEDGKFVF